MLALTILHTKTSIQPLCYIYDKGFQASSFARKPLPGGREGIRTPDLLNASQVLSQLSYTPSHR
jgi:hypothetical protein